MGKCETGSRRFLKKQNQVQASKDTWQVQNSRKYWLVGPCLWTYLYIWIRLKCLCKCSILWLGWREATKGNFLHALPWSIFSAASQCNGSGCAKHCKALNLKKKPPLGWWARSFKELKYWPPSFTLCSAPAQMIRTRTPLPPKKAPCPLKYLWLCRCSQKLSVRTGQEEAEPSALAGSYPRHAVRGKS